MGLVLGGERESTLVFSGGGCGSGGGGLGSVAGGGLGGGDRTWLGLGWLRLHVKFGNLKNFVGLGYTESFSDLLKTDMLIYTNKYLINSYKPLRLTYLYHLQNDLGSLFQEL